MGYKRQTVIDIAMKEVGYLEKATNSQLYDATANAGDKNFTKYAKDLHDAGYYNGNKNGYAWCDVFVDWCFFKAFGKNIGQALQCQTGDCGAGCTFSARYYKNKGQLHTSPQVGDQIFFGTESNVTHTGLVYKVDGSKVYTIEGNTSGASGVVANGGGVCKKSYSLTYSKIYAYGRPAYDDGYIVSGGSAAPESTKPSASTPSTSKKATDAAKSFNTSVAGTYKVTASALNVRNGAGTKKSIMTAIPKGTAVKCYGYYTEVDGVKWLYIQFTYKNVTYTGFASAKYLVK